MTRLFPLPLIALVALVAHAGAEVPTYRLDVVASFDVTTTVRGASDAGHVAGDQLVAGYGQPFVATVDDGLTLLPLPAGYISGLAMDVNVEGVVVGTVAENGLPWDFGEPAAWFPDGQDGYEAVLIDYPATVDVAGQNRPTDGGQVVAVNDAGQMVGFARLQGFIGGPTMLFSRDDEAVNLGELGFQAKAYDLNNQGVIVGDGLRMDIGTGEVVDLGLPEPNGGTPFSRVIGFAINDQNEVVAAADLASNPYENYLTYLHNDTDGWMQLNPSQLPSRFVGFYDNNDRGDVSASGGMLFREEQALIGGPDELLEASFASWNPALGYIDDRRRIATTAIEGAQNAIVVLTPLTAGDSNLDDLVDVTDLLLVADSYGQSGTVWATGDFDRDGMTGDEDLLLMAANYDDPTPLDGLGLDPEFLAAWEDAVAAQNTTAVPDVMASQLSAHPNPFNPTTTIEFAGLPAAASGSVRVYDARGQLVRTLHDGPFTSSRFTWDGRDHRGQPLATGVYLVVGRTSQERSVVKVTMTK
ncbi:hypothetical protein GF314_01505 [bacterium]|nr:hypothetical protein [bacterium]